MLSLIFKNQTTIMLKLILIPYVVNILLGICTPNNTETISNIENHKKENFGNMLSKSIKNAMNTLLLILGSVTVFILLNAILNPNNIPLFSGILEISQGLNSLIGINISIKIKELLAIFFISFGGLSIHLQIKGILSDTKISYLTFLKARIKQTVISCLIILFF